MNPQLLLLVALAIVVIASLMLMASLLLRQRQRRQADRALEKALAPIHGGDAQADPANDSMLEVAREQLGRLGRWLEGSLSHRLLLTSEDRLLLEQLNWNSSAGTAVYLGLRLSLALLCVLLALVFLSPRGMSGLFVLFASLAAGILVPKIILGSWAARKRKQVDDELPLVIDILRLLQGVGMSIDQSLQTVGERMTVVIPALGGEIRDANTAYMHGRTREQSLRRLAESYGNEELRSLVQIVVQVSAHGGAVQEPLRQFSMRLREQRRMTLKEKVGKLSVKMTVVMMLTLLPALMLVLAGPAIVALSGTVGKLGA
jgi:tight adherence protein C